MMHAREQHRVEVELENSREALVNEQEKVAQFSSLRGAIAAKEARLQRLHASLLKQQLAFRSLAGRLARAEALLAASARDARHKRISRGGRDDDAQLALLLKDTLCY